MASTSSQKLLSKTLSAVVTNATGEDFKLPASSNGFMAELIVTRTNGSLTLCDIEHSSDGITWHKLAVFTVPVAVTGKELVDITSNVLEKVRVIYTTTGTVDMIVDVKLHYRMIRG